MSIEEYLLNLILLMCSDMKKFLFLLLSVFATYMGWAQTPESALQSYNTFRKLSAAGAAESELYGALYQCYQDNMNVLRNLPSDTSQYEEAKSAILDCWPYLRMAATYYDKQGNRKRALQFSQAYVDVPVSSCFQNEHLVKDDFYPTMVFYAASNTFNAKDYNLAIKYFKEYLATGEQKHKYNVMKFMAVACVKVKDYNLAKHVLDDAVAAYSSDYDILSMAIDLCIETEDNRQLQIYVSKALILKPNEQKLLDLQGKLYEESGNYAEALKIYKLLFSKYTTSLPYAKHVALNSYNMGVVYTNKASLEDDKRIASQFDSQALSYFENAIPVLKSIINAEPAALPYHEALAVAYQVTGRGKDLETENKTISRLGGRMVSSDAVPSLLLYSPSKSAESSNSLHESGLKSVDVPLYSQYAKSFVEERIEKWQDKDPYETIEEYKARVTLKTRDAKIKSLLKEAENSYIKMYAREVRISDFRLCPYDAEHEVFLAESEFGDVLIPVPRANNEARIFESGWNATQCINPLYIIDNDKIVLRALTFVTPTGNSYRYDDNGAMDYTQTEVDIQFADIDYDSLGSGKSINARPKPGKEKVVIGMSDVDKNIPVTKVVNENTFAVVIANENYNMVSPVPMALNDGKVFCEYCHKTLGIPEDHIRFYNNATYGMMLHAMTDIQHIAEAYRGDINVIFYYAGHGFPNESTKDAYLLPIDGDGVHTEASYSLERLYSELSGLNVRAVYVFLDACFSGARRDGQMLVSARSVVAKPRPAAPQGNMIVFSAASGEETAFPYDEKGHGLFTYYLLKKLRESKGNATMEEISNYVIENVRQKSITVNKKMQNPQIIPSHSLITSWKNMKLK